MPSKGKETEQAAREAFESVGYEVYIPPKAKYREQDVFGLFDLLCFGHDGLIGVQVKTNHVQGIHAWFEEAKVYEEHLSDFHILYMVLHLDDDDVPVGWRVAQSTLEDYEWIWDGREFPETPSEEMLEVLR